jgi:predicted acylesterase/phospholipase RssA
VVAVTVPASVPARAERPSPRVALVAGGGAVKAYAFHLGVLAALEKDGFHFAGGSRWHPSPVPPRSRAIDLYVGSSAGACALASIASGRAVRELADGLRGRVPGVPTFGYRTLFVPVVPDPLSTLRRFQRRWSLRSLRPSHLADPGGIFSTSGVERFFRRYVLPANRFADLAPELYITATQVNTSRKVVFGPRDSLGKDGYDASCAYYDNVPISEAIAAAVAVPPVFAPYTIVNPSSGARFSYYDGEVREPLSVHVARDAGADFVIASTIWRPYRYDARVGTLAEMGMAALAEQAIFQMEEQKVTEERRRAERFDALLDLLDEHGARHDLDAGEVAALKARVSELLGHRRVRALYVAPEPEDHRFFLEKFFSFGWRQVERCMASGERAYRRAVSEDPGFLRALDAALSTPP